MPVLRVDLNKRGYPIHIGPGLLDRLGAYLAEIFPPATRILVVGDSVTLNLFEERAAQSLKGAGFEAGFFRVPRGEEAKELGQVALVARAAADFRLGRDDLLVALGGGAVGDLVGFCAASYMRGVSLVQVPTTLLAQVDSSVGGKVAVNLPGGKNLLGFFYQPRLVLMDTDVLESLPPREFRSGLMEIIKYGVLGDGELFLLLEKKVLPGGSLPREGLEDIIFKACRMKAEVVQRDEEETGPRMVLNLGHTLGHALERETGYEYFRHGEAVGIGMIWAARLSVRRGLLAAGEGQRIEALIGQGGFPPVPGSVTVEGLLNAMGRDKKRRGGENNYVLIRRIGRVEVRRDVSKPLIKETLDQLLTQLKQE